MDKRYKQLMEQQNVSKNVTAQVYEELANSKPKRKSVRWKTVLAVTCIILIIPLTVFAAENIFGVAKVKIGKIAYFPDMEGYSIRFENLNNYPLDAFPQKSQELKDDKDFHYRSWEEAENALGIDLLENTVLADAKKSEYYFPITDSIAHCVTGYRAEGGQLYYVCTEASYQYKHLGIQLLAKITVENPKLDEETKQTLHGITVGFDRIGDPDISYQEYTTKNGIPVVIVTTRVKDFTYYSAIFAVNDISYEIRSYSSANDEETEQQLLRDLLDGFQLQ